MQPLSSKTGVLLPLSWVASSAIAVTFAVCSFFWYRTESLRQEVQDLKTDVAVIKAVLAPQSVSGKIAIK